MDISQSKGSICHQKNVSCFDSKIIIGQQVPHLTLRFCWYSFQMVASVVKFDQLVGIVCFEALQERITRFVKKIFFILFQVLLTCNFFDTYNIIWIIYCFGDAFGVHSHFYHDFQRRSKSSYSCFCLLFDKSVFLGQNFFVLGKYKVIDQFEVEIPFSDHINFSPSDII